MNYRYSLAQPCFFKVTRRIDDEGKGYNSIILRANTHKAPVLLDELQAYHEECVMYHQLEEPMGPFTQVWKAIYDTETWSDYGYYLVGHRMGLNELLVAIRKHIIWPTHNLLAFGDRVPVGENNLVTYNDDYVLTGVNNPRSVRKLKRRDR